MMGGGGAGGGVSQLWKVEIGGSKQVESGKWKLGGSKLVESGNWGVKKFGLSSEIQTNRAQFLKYKNREAFSSLLRGGGCIRI